MSFLIPPKPLSRRALLRGAAWGGAVTVGLPRLSAMLNNSGTAYAAGAPLPKRFGVWFWGDGIVPERWIPKAAGQGAAWELSEELTPFAKVKSHLTVLTGLEVKTRGIVHREGPAGVLSGAPHDPGGNFTAATIDQVIAKKFVGQTTFGSLQVGVCRATANAPGTAVNFASAANASAPIAPVYDAKALFNRLFGKATPASPTSAASDELDAKIRGSVLDVVMADAVLLQKRLGAEDIRRLDQHLDGLRELEKRVLALPSQVACGALPANAADTYPKVLPDNNAEAPPELNQAMGDLMAYALSCDLTRVFTFQWSRPAAHIYFRSLGFTDDYHDDISHKEPGNQPRMNMGILYMMDHFRVFLEKLQNTPDGAGTLLDNCCVYGTSDVSWGRPHSVDEYPLILAGRAGGLLKGNLHYRSANKENTSKLLFTLMNMFAGETKTFGQGAGQVSDGIGAVLA